MQAKITGCTNETQKSEKENTFQDKEIGLIPEDWKVVRLADVVDFSRKPRDLDLNLFEKIPFVTMEMIPIGKTYVNTYLLKEPARISSGVYCERGDILLSKITPCFENGKQGIIENIPCNFAYATTEVYPIKPKDVHLDKMFLFYFLIEPDVRKTIAGKMQGATGRRRVPKDIIKNTLIPFPPFLEQQKIAEVLGTVQRAIEQQAKIIEAAKNLKKSLMKKLFSEGLKEDEQKETEIGEIPKSWKISNLEDFCKNIIDCLHSLKPKKQKFGKKCLQVYNIANSGKLDLTSIYYISESDFELWTSRIKPQKNDIIISKTGRVGAIAQILDDDEYCIGRNLVLIRPDEKKIEPYYLRYYMLSPFFRREVERLTQLGTILKSLHVAKIPELKIILPSKEEQKQIASIFETIHKKIETEERKEVVLQELFKTMLHKLMTAEIRLKDIEV